MSLWLSQERTTYWQYHFSETVELFRGEISLQCCTNLVLFDDNGVTERRHHHVITHVCATHLATCSWFLFYLFLLITEFAKWQLVQIIHAFTALMLSHLLFWSLNIIQDAFKTRWKRELVFTSSRECGTSPDKQFDHFLTCCEKKLAVFFLTHSILFRFWSKNCRPCDSSATSKRPLILQLHPK